VIWKGVSKKMYNYISLFSGAGGLDIGIERSGFNLVSMCEIEKVFCETLEANKGWTHCDGKDYFQNTKIINADIKEVGSSELTCGENIDLIVGGPPCQAFSSSGKQLSVLDPRGALVTEFHRVVEEVKPRMFLFENVRGIVTARDANGNPGGVITSILEYFEEIGYSCRTALLNSADYGSHQRRVRCFIIGSLKGLAPTFPKPTHSKSALANNSLFEKPWNTLGQFLEEHFDRDKENYTYPTYNMAAQLEGIKDGSGLKSMGKAEKTRPGGHWGYRQGTFIADLNLPARTVTGSSSQDWVRWDGDLRRLTLKEVQMLQGFPADWVVKGKRTEVFKQIGNAVPTVFGEKLGELLMQHLDNFPATNPVFIEMPKSYKGYIEYTRKDHERNKDSRTVHKQFK